MSQWTSVCLLTDIAPGTGVCGLVDGEQVALFRPSQDDRVYGLNNMDPFAHSNVLSRGLICEHKDELWVASPLKKQRFNLQTGCCLEDPRFSIKTYAVRVEDNHVQVRVQSEQ
jgi:nitrite reductase (NADH) small subunit